eukprot:1409736-Prymnesium_polylepis.1
MELHRRAPAWAAAASRLRSVGEGGSSAEASSTGLAQRLIESLEAGEAGHPAHASCVLLRHIEGGGGAPAADSLRVVAAAPGAASQLQRAKQGAVWR